MALVKTSKKILLNEDVKLLKVDAKQKQEVIRKNQTIPTIVWQNSVNAKIRAHVRLMDEMVLNDQNMKAKCSTCLRETKDHFTIHDEFEYMETKVPKTVSVLNVLEQFMSIKFNYVENYFKSICKDCLNLIELLLMFRVQCHRSQTIISNYKVQCDIKKVSQSKIADCQVREDKNAKTGVNSEEKEKFQPNLCGKSYSTDKDLNTPKKQRDNEYKCNMCTKIFTDKRQFRTHMKSHKGEPIYACKLCGKRYKQSGSLSVHMRIHTGQKPYLCSICGKTFRHSPDLKYHTMTHTKEKPFMCSICGKTMSMHSHFVRHVRTHTGERPFKCKNCDKAFPTTSCLKRHEIIHTGQKPYSCDICKKSFNRRSTLKVHSKIHTNERPYVCPMCNKRFIQAQSLKTHLQNHFN